MAEATDVVSCDKADQVDSDDTVDEDSDSDSTSEDEEESEDLTPYDKAAKRIKVQGFLNALLYIFLHKCL